MAQALIPNVEYPNEKKVERTQNFRTKSTNNNFTSFFLTVSTNMLMFHPSGSNQSVFESVSTFVSRLCPADLCVCFLFTCLFNRWNT